MTEQQRDARFIEAARARLDESAEALDGATLSRLRQARARALQAAPSTTGRRGWFWPWRRPWAWASAGMVSAAAGVLAVALLFKTVDGPVDAEEMLDMDILAASESLEFYEELEFIQWLAEEDAGAG